MYRLAESSIFSLCRRFCATGLLFLVVGCGGGGSATPSGDPGVDDNAEQQWRLTVVNNSADRAPVTGIDVKLYAGDLQQADAGIQTNDEGTVAFSVTIGAEPATRTLALTFDDEIRVLADMPAGDYRIALRKPPCTPIGEVDLIANGFPLGGVRAVAQPFGDTDSSRESRISGSLAEFTGLTACAEQLVDGTISPLILAYNTRQLTGWGFKSALALSELQGLTLTVDQVPEDLSWTSLDPDTVPETIRLSGIRQNVLYEDLGSFNNSGNDPSGVLRIADGFPASRYIIGATRKNDFIEQSFSRTFDNAPTDIEISFGDIAVSGFVFNKEANSFDLESVPGLKVDLIHISVTFTDATGGTIHLDYFAPGDRFKLRIPALNDSLDQRLAESSLVDAGLSLYNFSPTSNYTGVASLFSEISDDFSHISAWSKNELFLTETPADENNSSRVK